MNQQEQGRLRKDPRNGFPGVGKQTELSGLGVLVLSDIGILFSALLFCLNNLNVWRYLLHPGFFLEKENSVQKTLTGGGLTLGRIFQLLFNQLFALRFGSGCIFCSYRPGF